MTEQEYMTYLNKLPSFMRDKLMQQFTDNKAMNIEQQMANRTAELSNFNSPVYQQYRSYLQKAYQPMGTNGLLSLASAGGYSQGAAMALAQAKAKEQGVQMNDSINQSVQGFALNNQNQINGLLGMQSDAVARQQQMNFQRQQYNDSQDFGNQLLNTAGGLLGYGVGNLFSGKSFFGGSKSSGVGYASPAQGGY